jgi:hypothetical protein
MIEDANAPGLVQPMTRLCSLFILVALVGASGCLKQEFQETPLEPDAIFQDASEVLTGTLSPGATTFRTFTVTFGADVKITLASLTRGTATLSVPLSLGFGTPSTDGSTCTTTAAQTQTVIPALTTHFSQTLTTGSYCVVLTDSGNLTADTNFAVRVRQSLALPNYGAAGTETYSTNLYPGGTFNRTFGVAGGGEIKVVLTSVTPQATLGMALGVADDNVTDCYPTITTTGGTGATLIANSEKGAFCVKVFDPGGLTDRVLFNVQVTHP